MERTVPSSASEEVELYTRTYYSLLRSTSDVQIKTIEEVHSSTNSLLHSGARSSKPDMSAFIYSLLRLPDCVKDVRVLILGQGFDVFRRSGIGDVENWKQVSAPARRRRCFYDGNETLACIIASRSDIDDVVPLLTAYQIEWNKLNQALSEMDESYLLAENPDYDEWMETVAKSIDMSVDDLQRLESIWGDKFQERMLEIKSRRCRIKIRLTSGSLSEYRRATHKWWENIENKVPELTDRPVYFVSSNTHSLVNLLSGYALKHREELLDYLYQSENKNLINEWLEIEARNIPSSQENFLYYLLKKYLTSEKGKDHKAKRKAQEESIGITRVDSSLYFDVDAQVIELRNLKPETLDPRLCQNDLEFLTRSDAFIVNIDYPLGLAAYNILTEVSDHVGSILGVYIMGKAATLNGVIGDVMIPTVVHDEHSRNSYLFQNAFSAGDVADDLVYSTVLDNQKAVTVEGTFLQNATYMDVFYREGYTDIEMEAGPYLSAVYEMYRPKRHPINEIIYLNNLNFDLGILHYASDTPLGKGKNLGAGTLSYFGMDPTYATSLAILKRILKKEKVRLGNLT